MSEVVVVTGASAGIGRATAVAFARRGDRVAVVRDPQTWAGRHHGAVVAGLGTALAGVSASRRGR